MAAYDDTVGDGYEPMFQTNHLGHFAFINTLLPMIKMSAEKISGGNGGGGGDGARVVITSSDAHTFVKGIDWEGLEMRGKPQPEKRGLGSVKTGMQIYGQSKLANLLYMQELDRRLRSEGVENVWVNAVHPGFVRGTGLGRQVRMMPSLFSFIFIASKGHFLAPFVALLDSL